MLVWNALLNPNNSKPLVINKWNLIESSPSSKTYEIEFDKEYRGTNPHPTLKGELIMPKNLFLTFSRNVKGTKVISFPKNQLGLQQWKGTKWVGVWVTGYIQEINIEDGWMGITAGLGKLKGTIYDRPEAVIEIMSKTQWKN